MNRPNIVLINCDDLGYGDLHCYGSKVNDTPFIDSLAAEGMQFTSFYAASPVCSPSRASLMTACLPPRISLNRVLFPGEPFGLNPSEYTIGNMFQDNGYSTMIIGKWHCGDQTEVLPTNFGFDDYYGLPYSNDMGMQVNTEKEDRENFNPFSKTPLPLIHGTEVIEQQPDQRSLTERYVEKANEFIRANKEKPFFLYFAQMHVHLPLYAHETFVEQSRNGDFGACVSEVDWSCKALVAELKRLGLYENTLIIFTSDNGSRAADGASNAPLRGNKFTTFEGGMRVPFIAHWKNHIKPNSINHNIASNIDLMPSLAKIIGAKLPENLVIDGMDVSNYFYDTETVIRDEMIYYRQSSSVKTGFLNAVRKGDWKLHLAIDQNDHGDYKLYNLKEDISESCDVSEQYPDIVSSLESIAVRYREILGDEYYDIKGAEVREGFETENPTPLCFYDENHPYIVALYDKSDRG